MDTTELQNQAIEIRDAENEGENTALRVGTMLLAIIDAFANIVDLDTLQQILEQYAGTTGSGQIYWRHARCVFLASMGAELDAVNGDGWEYTNHNGDIVFNPTSKNLRVVGETGSYFVYTNVLYVHAHTSHAYKWDAAEQKMVEVSDSNLPAVITYKNTPAFSQVAIGESYVFQSQSSGPKIAIKISSSETYSFLPDPKKIYAFRDIRQAMLWKPSNQTWVSLTPRVINDLTTGGEGDALSAEMGKKIRQNITILLSRLGNYAFPNGKPTLDWGDGGGGDDPVLPTYSVQKTIGTGLSASGGDDDVNEGDRLEVTIAITNDLYIIDEDNVEVTMDGSPVDGAFDAATGKITIAEVYGEVVINVPSMTYVQDNLVLHLDGKHRGGTGSAVSGHWKSLVNYNGSPIDFTLTSCDESHDDYVGFNGTTSKGVGSISLLDVAASAATTEVALSGLTTTDSDACCVLHNNIGSNNRVALSFVGVSNGIRDTNISTSPFSSAPGLIQLPQSKWGSFCLSVMSGSGKINGEDMNISTAGSQIANANSYLALFMRYVDTSSNQYAYSKGNLHSLRVYSRHLTDLERAQNLKVDRKRFNLGY